MATAPARRVLVIDDERGIRSLTARALTPAGFTVALAATGHQGLSIALRDPCDLVVLDLDLPDLDGEELLRRLRRQRPGQAVLIWSATGDRHAASRCRSLGACGYLAKPFSLNELIRSVTATCP
jgi:DNA-binding response OmpR family regulator